MLVVNCIGNAASTVNVVQNAGAKVFRYAKLNQVCTHRAAQVVHRCVGYAQLSSKSGHGACNSVGINSTTPPRLAVDMSVSYQVTSHCPPLDYGTD
jgi:hypothetical protein